MTRRDYIVVAKVIRGLRGYADQLSQKVIVDAFAAEFLRDKPTFSVDKFRKECER